jgi:hypothetical protein
MRFGTAQQQGMYGEVVSENFKKQVEGVYSSTDI